MTLTPLKMTELSTSVLYDTIAATVWTKMKTKAYKCWETAAHAIFSPNLT